MKKILCFGMSDNLGGIEKFIITYYRKIDKEEFKIDFVKTQDKICFEDELIESGSTIYKITSRSKNVIKYCKELYQLLKTKKEYEILHVNLNTLSSIEACILGKLTGKKVIVHSHNIWQGKGKITKILIKINSKIIGKVSDKYLACSKVAGEYMFKDKKFEIISNAIDLSEYKYDKTIRDYVRKELNIKNEKIIGIVGRLEYQKNHIFLLNILKELIQKDENIKLLIVGDGHLRENLENYAKETKISNNIIWTGIRNDVERLLQAMDLFVLPSLYEGLGIVLIEAQATGLNCIVSEAIQPEACITDLVIKENLSDSAQWVNTILEILNNRNTRENYKEDIKKAGYDIDTEVRKLEYIYNNL